jgi:hypothetical protein
MAGHITESVQVRAVTGPGRATLTVSCRTSVTVTVGSDSGPRRAHESDTRPTEPWAALAVTVMARPPGVTAARVPA